jgi:radical SAM superfamily enzyme YgiQ (UPF0313 family)
MVTAYTGFQLHDAYRLIKLFKSVNPKKHITIGGPHASIYPDQCLADPYIDDVWTGYAERGEYPMPWHLINVKDYINPATERMIYISSYGCPGICTFCAQKTHRDLVFIPLEKVKNDIDSLMELYPFKECVFFDATLFTVPRRAYYISELMRKHHLKWICDSRADEICRTSPLMLGQIVDSGLTQITIGLESGSQRVVSRMKKGLEHLENFKKCAEILSRYDVKMVSGVIFGTPGENPDDIRQTIDYIKEVKSINPNFFISTTFYKPLPDTKMADMCKPYGYTEPDTLEGWAEHGAAGHYQYNSWDDVPWIENKTEYKAIYDEFVAGNSGLFI